LYSVYIGIHCICLSCVQYILGKTIFVYLVFSIYWDTQYLFILYSVYIGIHCICLSCVQYILGKTIFVYLVFSIYWYTLYLLILCSVYIGTHCVFFILCSVYIGTHCICLSCVQYILVHTVCVYLVFSIYWNTLYLFILCSVYIRTNCICLSCVQYILGHTAHLMPRCTSWPGSISLLLLFLSTLHKVRNSEHYVSFYIFKYNKSSFNFLCYQSWKL